MEINVNLASHPFVDWAPALKKMRSATRVLAIIACLLSAGLYYLHSKAVAAQARVRILDDRIRQVRTEESTYIAAMRKQETAQLVDEINALNPIFDRKAFSWTLILKDLEMVLPSHVQVTMIDPVMTTDGKITLHIRVLGQRDQGVELVENLEQSYHFLNPRIVAEMDGSNGGVMPASSGSSLPNSTEFDLLAEYNAGSPDDLGASEKALSVAEAEVKPKSASKGRAAGPQVAAVIPRTKGGR